ncbi:hypothetical protein PoB_007498200, partial [Plakobranchus ocellatus]
MFFSVSTYDHVTTSTTEERPSVQSQHPSPTVGSSRAPLLSGQPAVQAPTTSNPVQMAKKAPSHPAPPPAQGAGPQHQQQRSDANPSDQSFQQSQQHCNQDTGNQQPCNRDTGNQQH